MMLLRSNTTMRIYSYEDLKEVATDDEHKAHLLDMLTAFDGFCRENGLRYYLSGGTLLGAIRHKGFIPWDDDIDVNMPRPDCEKLMEISGGIIGKYKLNPPNYTNEYHAFHWKLYDESMLVGKRKNNGIGNKIYPIFMDIFPIEGLPDTEEDNIKHYMDIMMWKRRADYLWGKRKYKGKNPVRKLKNLCAVKKAEHLGKETLFNHVIAVAKAIPFDQADYIGVMMTNVHTTEERVLKEEYVPVIQVPFEGRMFSAPAGYDTYLRQLYGEDYMELLPVYQRVSKHALVPFHSNINIAK